MQQKVKKSSQLVSLSTIEHRKCIMLVLAVVEVVVGGGGAVGCGAIGDGSGTDGAVDCGGSGGDIGCG